MIVAIDGPAGAGKGTVARAVAARLGFRYLDTGAMYRAVALKALRDDVPVDDPDRVSALARAATIDVAGERVALDGVDVTDAIRGPDVTRAVSSVAAHPGVREDLVARQRRVIEDGGDVVMEGRDIGTTVAPDADVKIFLWASLEERARRRALQLGLPDDAAERARVARSMSARDRADAARSASPFAKAADAVEVDSTAKDVDAVVDEVVSIVRRVRPDVRS